MSVNQGTGLVDGVRTLLDAPRTPGPDDIFLGAPRDVALAHLIFRVGVVDEPLWMRGVTHLALRLADEVAGEFGTYSSVSVGLTTSTVSVKGTAAQVASYLQRFTSAANSAHPEELVERLGVTLLAEEGRGGGGEALPLATLHFGSVGYGVTAFDQLALHSLTPSDVSGWSMRWLTCGNCVLEGEGLDAGSLRLALVDGASRPEPRVRSASHEPRQYDLDVGADPTLSAVVPLDWSVHLTTWILNREVVRAVGREGEVRSDTIRLNSAEAMMVVSIAPLPGKGAVCSDGLVQAYEALVASGVSLDAHAAAVETLLRRTGELSPSDVRREVALESLRDAAGGWGG